MLRIILAGCHGRMGKQVTECCTPLTDVRISAGLDSSVCPAKEFPVFSDPLECRVPADVLIDFSHPDALNPLLAFCIKRKLPAVLAVTGYSQRQLEQIRAASRSIAVFRSANLSIGANLLRKIIQQTASTLGDGFDITILEQHHKHKADTPSGTAIMLSKSLPQNAEILSIRAGNAAGEHHVLFSGPNEVLEFTHRTLSRDVYAAGAIRAARFITRVGRPGLYGMEHLLK